MSEAADTILSVALERLRVLGSVSDEPGRLLRTLLSPANRRAAELIGSWMTETGLAVSRDVMGSLRGVLPGTHPQATPFLLGSHFDSATDGGRFDGSLGLVVALAAIDRLAAENLHLPIPLHLLAFSDSGGGRFPATYLSSRTITGEFDRALPKLNDETGQSFAKFLEQEGWHEAAGPIRYPTASARGYLEIHVEQGPALEGLGLPAGVVTAISGRTRVMVLLHGRTGHSGNTAMAHRRDALAAAAECLTAIENHAAGHAPFLATVGKFSVEPNAPDSIPGKVNFTLDLHHPDDDLRADYLEKLRFLNSTIAHRRGLEMEWRVVGNHDGVPCDALLTQRLAGALTTIAGSAPFLPSGAGHDGVAMAAVAPIAMLFVRCRGDHSHHADEHVDDADVALAIDVLHRFLKSFLVGS